MTPSCMGVGAGGGEVGIAVPVAGQVTEEFRTVFQVVGFAYRVETNEKKYRTFWRESLVTDSRQVVGFVETERRLSESIFFQRLIHLGGDDTDSFVAPLGCVDVFAVGNEPGGAANRTAGQISRVRMSCSIFHPGQTNNKAEGE
ncbi:hypothetical protein ZOD2009_12010 [Haladaptatus paucihalophilus DX253]|uniref:Uncharacterized protein n=1 Tax=Haladaptatus paucihalophilus DX253 TaxID=797209 RepID=E7QUC2_HALPU|nr:hypothetical protein ZOD2009_12010 [Haladaptatus paucihalophilus DX253]